MSIAALTVWLMTAGAALHLLTIWLIEFDDAISRCPSSSGTASSPWPRSFSCC